MSNAPAEPVPLLGPPPSHPDPDQLPLGDLAMTYEEVVLTAVNRAAMERVEKQTLILCNIVNRLALEGHELTREIDDVVTELESIMRDFSDVEWRRRTLK